MTPNLPDLRRPWDRMDERLGSSTNPSHFVILHDAVNVTKGNLKAFQSPQSLSDSRSYVRKALNGDETAAEAFMTPLRKVSRLFLCLN
jgi:chitinase